MNLAALSGGVGLTRNHPARVLRDNVLMTPEGAIVGRQAMECRRGEERYAAEALAELGVRDIVLAKAPLAR